MAKKKDIKKDKPKKEKKKPIYEIQGFVLTIPKDLLDSMLRDASNPRSKNENNQ